MTDNNIEWKKKKDVGEKERPGINNNIKKAESYDAKAKNTVQQSGVKPSDLSIGLKKLRKQINDYYDEDDENEIIYQADTSNSLLNALTEDEKKTLRQKESIKEQESKKTVGKIKELTKVAKLVKSLQHNKISSKVADKVIQDQTLSPDKVLSKILKDDFAKKHKICLHKLSDNDIPDFIAGVKKVQKIAGTKALDGMSTDDVIIIGKSDHDEKKIAKTILKKSGRMDGKTKKKLESKAKLVNKKKEVKNVKNKAHTY